MAKTPEDFQEHIDPLAWNGAADMQDIDPPYPKEPVNFSIRLEVLMR